MLHWTIKEQEASTKDHWIVLSVTTTRHGWSGQDIASDRGMNACFDSQNRDLGYGIDIYTLDFIDAESNLIVRLIEVKDTDNFKKANSTGPEPEYALHH
ncbi:MAG: hypothetical protein OXE42_08630 [Gammaproteobacteria bacterium]|nr:hypothetical protein [Gammaproteobacteria bacterium]